MTYDNTDPNRAVYSIEEAQTIAKANPLYAKLTPEAKQIFDQRLSEAVRQGTDVAYAGFTGTPVTPAMIEHGAVLARGAFADEELRQRQIAAGTAIDHSKLPAGYAAALQRVGATDSQIRQFAVGMYRAVDPSLSEAQCLERWTKDASKMGDQDLPGTQNVYGNG